MNRLPQHLDRACLIQGASHYYAVILGVKGSDVTFRCPYHDLPEGHAQLNDVKYNAISDLWEIARATAEESQPK